MVNATPRLAWDMQSESKCQDCFWPDTKRLLGSQNVRGLLMLLALTLISGCAITNYNPEAINDRDHYDPRYDDRPALQIFPFEFPTSR